LLYMISCIALSQYTEHMRAVYHAIGRRFYNIKPHVFLTRVAGAVSIAAQVFAKGKVKSYFDHQLEAFKAQLAKDLKTHQAELAQLADAAKFDYARRLADFNLFARRRHVVYARLFGLYRAAWDAYDQFGVRFHHWPGYKEYDESKVMALMTEKGVPGDQQRNVLDVWKNDRDRGLALLHAALDPHYQRRARALWDKAQDYWLANYLYLSSDANARVESSLVPSLDRFARLVEPELTDAQRADKAFGKELEEKRLALQKEMETKIADLAAALRRELAAGDYPKVVHRSVVDGELPMDRIQGPALGGAREPAAGP